MLEFEKTTKLKEYQCLGRYSSENGCDMELDSVCLNGDCNDCPSFGCNDYDCSNCNILDCINQKK